MTLVLTLTLTRVGPTTVCRRGRRPCVATSVPRSSASLFDVAPLTQLRGANLGSWLIPEKAFMRLILTQPLP